MSVYNTKLWRENRLEKQSCKQLKKEDRSRVRQPSVKSSKTDHQRALNKKSKQVKSHGELGGIMKVVTPASPLTSTDKYPGNIDHRLRFQEFLKILAYSSRIPGGFRFNPVDIARPPPPRKFLVIISVGPQEFQEVWHVSLSWALKNSTILQPGWGCGGGGGCAYLILQGALVARSFLFGKLSLTTFLRSSVPCLS